MRTRLLVAGGILVSRVLASQAAMDRELERDWVSIASETMRSRIERVEHDLDSLNDFYSVETSPTRYTRFRSFYVDELEQLDTLPFDTYSQDDKVDYLLLKKYLTRELSKLDLDKKRDDAIESFISPFAKDIIHLCEARQRVDPLNPQDIAKTFFDVEKAVKTIQSDVQSGKITLPSTSAFRASRVVEQLIGHLSEFFRFYNSYDPSFDWWVTDPYTRLNATLKALIPVINEKLVGVKPGDTSTIIGEPIGRDGLLTELEAESIPYTPEELIKIAETEYKWCEETMIQASTDLGFGKTWRDALEHVKNLYVPPGEQPALIKKLVNEGNDFIHEHDLVTVPALAAETWTMTMISAERQKVSPFFLGGSTIQVSYPTDEMAHDEKLMSMRGNNPHFSRATAFHEMIPGHHLQLYIGDRSHPYRTLFSTPFFVEGWALYWEMVFWNRGDFFITPEDRVGTMFWRMHRCARIIFSLRFHLGTMTPEEAVDLLVNWVGHERSTAEGEVRRSFGGDYSPLYQAGYMLGALQLINLREEVLGNKGKNGTGTDTGLGIGEKQFHDRILAANTMPIELLRALILEQDLKPDFKSSWRFYGDKV